jgi:hypothetical protein
LLPSLEAQDLPAVATSVDLSNIGWVLGLAFGLTSAGLARAHGDAMNPARFSLFAFGAVALLGWATYASGTPGGWLWVIPWLMAAVLIYSGAREVKYYRDWAAYLGYLLALVSVAGAVFVGLWSFDLMAKPTLMAQAPEQAPAATLAPILAPTQAPEPTEVPQPAGAGAEQPRDVGFVWTFLVEAFTSIWGIVHLLVIVLLGEIWIKRWGGPLFLMLLLAAAWYFGSTSAEAQAAWVSWITSSPASWMRSILDYSISTYDTPGIGILLVGLGLSVLLFPAARLTFRGTQTIQTAGMMKNLLGSTAAFRYMSLKGVSQGRLALAGILNSALVFGAAISLWSALQSLLKAGTYPDEKLGFLFVPNLAIPSFKPVWEWPYFALAGIAWLALMISVVIQRRYISVLPYAGCQNPLVSLVMLMVSAMFMPAGVMLFSTVQIVCQWVEVPLAFLGQQATPAPRRPIEQAPIEQPYESIEEPYTPIQEEVESAPPVTVPPVTTPPITIAPIPIEPEMIGEEVFTLSEPLAGLAVNDQGQCLALAKSGSLGLYEGGTLKVRTKIDLTAPVGLAWAARGELVVIGRNGKLVVLQPSEAGFEMVREGELSIPVRSYALNPFGTLLTCCHADMGKVCGVFIGKMDERVFSDQIENPTALGFSPDGRYLAIGSETGATHILDIATRQPMHVLEVSDTDLEGAVRQVSGFKKDGQPCWLVIYENDTVGLWAADGELLDQTDLSFTANCLALDLEREFFAVGGAEGQLEVYSSDLLLELDGQAHDGKVIQLAFDKSSGKLISAGSDNMVKEIQI